MDNHFRNAFEALNAARPASGFRPETEAEWEKLQQAQIKLSFAAYKAAGASDSEARALSEFIHGGRSGRLLLEIFFAE